MIEKESKYCYAAQLMNQALLDLLEKKEIEFISVTEIAKKAGVNRSTFYLHYENVYELLEETIENTNKKFLQSFKNCEKPDVTSRLGAFLVTEEFLVPYLKFCRENKRLFKLAHKRPTVFGNKKAYQNMYEKVFYPAVSQFIKEENARVYVLEFFTQGVVGIINKWVEDDCKTEIEELVKVIESCIGYKKN